MARRFEAGESVQALPARPLVIRHRRSLLQQAPQLSTEVTDQKHTFIMKEPQPRTFSLSMPQMTLSSVMTFALIPILLCTRKAHHLPCITARLILREHTAFGPVLPYVNLCTSGLQREAGVQGCKCTPYSSNSYWRAGEGLHLQQSTIQRTCG